MSSQSVAERLDRVERKPLKYGAGRTTESFVRAGQVVEKALEKAYSKRETAAEDYGVTASLMTRQMQNADNQHLSFQRLWSMPDAFRRELLVQMADDLGLESELTFRIRRTA